MSARPGQHWGRNGETWVVRRVDGRGVLIEGLVGIELVPHYTWPGTFLRVDDLTAGNRPGPALRAMLVGGATGQHFTRIWDQSAELNVDIDHHWPGDVHRSPPSLPSDLDLVILLVSHTGRRAANAVRRMAKSRGIPVVMLPSAGFQPLLKTELDRLNLPTERFGILSEEAGSTWYSWSGQTWVLQGRSPRVTEPVDGLCGTPGSEDAALAAMLAALGVGMLAFS